MSIPAISINRPVGAWMLMLFLIVFGAISFDRLGVSQMPDVDFPVLSVSTTWEGAAPEVIESEIVDKIEQRVVSVEGVREIVSSIRQGQANVTLEFDLSRDIDAALQEVQSSLSQIKLPLDVDPPVIRKTNPDDQPIIWVGISSKTRSLRDLISYVDLSLKDQFEVLPGVGEVFLGGFTDRSLRVWVKKDELDKHELTVSDVRQAIAQGHVEVAAGVIENSSQEINLRVMGEGLTTEQVGNLLIDKRGGRPIFGAEIRLKDVAEIEDGLGDVRRLSRINGTPGLGLGIKKQRGSNAVEVGQAVKAKVVDLAKTLPGDMEIGINFDTTQFVEEAVAETEFTLILSAIITGFVCWLFLGSLKPTINILLAIPTSIVGSFIVMYFLGFTLNLFTLLALALAIGIVVDDAIMVLENIYRHSDMGKKRRLAALDGANEIAPAAIAASVAVIAIFLPVAFMEGIIGKFFFQFGVTISVAVALSLLEAVTLTPMRCAYMSEAKDEEGIITGFMNRLFARLSALYRYSLQLALNHKAFVLIGAALIFAGSLGLMPTLRKEFIPPQDQSSFMIRFQTPVGSSLEFTSESLRAAEKYLLARPEIRRVFGAVGGFGGGEVNTGILFVSLKPPSERSQSQSEIMQIYREDLAKLPNLKVFIQDLSMRGFTSQRGFPVEFNIRGPDWGVLNDSAAKIIEKLSATGLVADVDTDYRIGQPEVRIWPIREEAARRGVTMSAIAETISAAVGGIREGKYTADGRRYDVRIRLLKDERLTPDVINSLNVRNVHGELVPVKDIVKIEPNVTLQTIVRRNRERSITVSANVAPNASQGAALDKAQEIGNEILPEGYRLFLGGGSQTFKESFSSLKLVLWLGVIVAYMVLAAQFNSFIHPITVLLALPFSLTGAIAALWITDLSLNLYSMIGIVLLMGIVKKNSILLVEFASTRRAAGKSANDAILEAGPVRLRPIAMTTLSTVAAALPPALALGPGAESRIPMAVAVMGGVLVSALFTLYVVPCAYVLLSKFQRD